MTAETDAEIHEDAEKRRFEPPPLEGRGIAGRLTRYGLDHARTSGLAVAPICPYVAAYIQRHPEYQDLVA